MTTVNIYIHINGKDVCVKACSETTPSNFNQCTVDTHGCYPTPEPYHGEGKRPPYWFRPAGYDPKSILGGSDPELFRGESDDSKSDNETS